RSRRARSNSQRCCVSALSVCSLETPHIMRTSCRMTESDPEPTCSGSPIRSARRYRLKVPSTLQCQIQGAIGCVSLVEKRVLKTGSDRGNQCDGANSSHFLPALPLLDRQRLSLRHARFTASVR